MQVCRIYTHVRSQLPNTLDLNQSACRYMLEQLSRYTEQASLEGNMTVQLMLKLWNHDVNIRKIFLGSVRLRLI